MGFFDYFFILCFLIFFILFAAFLYFTYWYDISPKEITKNSIENVEINIMDNRDKQVRRWIGYFVLIALSCIMAITGAQSFSKRN